MEKQGLSIFEAQERLKQWGFNEVVPNHANTVFTEMKKIFLDPMGLMLLSLSGLYWFLGDKTDAVILFIAFFPVTAVDVILGIQSGKALKALKGTLTLNAKILRAGVIQEIPIRNIVPDDIIIFEEGQTLPADGLIIEAENLTITEAALTGESIPITKKIDESFFGGTTILTGRGLGRVQQTGQRSKFGAIEILMGDTVETTSPLRKTVDRLVKIVVGIAFVFAILLFVLQWSTTHQFIPSLIIALTLGMAAVPEEFPLVFTLYLSLGAWRLSKRKVLVKSLPSVEALGGVDVICTDKTGTLTEGVFQLEELRKIDAFLSEENIWQFALMACEVIAVDSMEIPIVEKGKTFKNTLANWELLHDYSFDLKSKTMAHVWKNTKTSEMMIAMKGAAEGVLAHCALDAQAKASIDKTLETLSSQGKRILGLAGKKILSTGNRLEDEANLNFIGFLVFSDPVRPSVKQAIQDCQDAGIQIKMLTGDHLLTAHSIADQIGLEHSHKFLFTGEILSKMNLAERSKAYLDGAVFARVTPEQKYEMVKALQAQGKIVAMTGDGINDAPALRLADIGISMGKTATDVARSTAKMVLLENDFSGIVAAVFEGRKIFSNLRRSFSYLIAFHIPVILLALIPPFLKWPSILLPVHIILLELVVHPISAFTFENIESKEAEKNNQRSLMSKTQLIRTSLSGILLSLTSILIFKNNASASVDQARSIAFSMVLIGNIFFVFSETFPILNRRFYMTAAALFMLTILLTMTKVLSSYLHFEPITGLQFVSVVCLSAIATCPGFLKGKKAKIADLNKPAKTITTL
jgi:Ca2+-transporting ATPase